MLQMHNVHHYYTNMEIDDIRAFVAVAGAGSVSGAARELFRTQPAVTRRLQRLEDTLGAQLLDRRRRPFTLTPAGQATLARCRQLLASAEELRSMVEGMQEPGGDLRVGVANALTELTLEGPVTELQRSFPKVMIRLSAGWSRDVLARVKSGALDTAVVLLPEGQGIPDSLAGRALAAEHLAIIAPRRWQSRFPRVRDFADAQWIVNPEGCSARRELQQTLARLRLPFRVSVETYDYQLQMSLVAHGRGLGLVPNRLIMRSPLRTKLTKLRLRDLEFPFTIWIATGAVAAPLAQPVEALGRALTTSLSRSRERPRSHSDSD
jgi:DNA-binding transcriptional LysR family regulator